MKYATNERGYTREMERTADMFKDALDAYICEDGAEILGRFFKTGKGQYGEGDIFIGVRVPDTRRVCQEFKSMPLPEIQELLESPIHEHRLAAVILLSNQFSKASVASQKAIYDVYMQALGLGQLNNWDIIDSSADRIVGAYLENKPHDLLFTLAQNDDLWHRRVAVIASFWFIKRGDPSTTLALAEQLLDDRRDLIQKAVGWMLREIGKRVDRALLIDFLDHHAHEMPRTMLRYSIEHLTPAQRKHYMNFTK